MMARPDGTILNEGDGCDWCSAPHATRRYPCKDYIAGPLKSIGAWKACESCAELVDRDTEADRAELLKRGLFSDMKSVPPGTTAEGWELARKNVALLQELFRKNRLIEWRLRGYG